MPKLGIYYIPPGPPADNAAFYQAGKSILGYDIRAETENVTPPADIEHRIGFTAAWSVNARQYGFHSTIVDVINCGEGDLPTLAERVSAILGTFVPEENPFSLTRNDEEPIAWFTSGAVALKYTANPHLRRFRRLLKEKIRPRSRGQWKPHFTLFDPYTGRRGGAVKKYLEEEFSEYSPLNVESVCLVVQRDGDPNFNIFQELPYRPEGTRP